jgi:hypothetical protein
MWHDPRESNIGVVVNLLNSGLLQSARSKSYQFRRLIAWTIKRLRMPREPFFRFTCNVCGRKCSFPRHEVTRERWSCRHCGSTVRWRGVIHALSIALFGESMAIRDFPLRPELVGAGMSDWDGYALRLARKLGYTNTYYHKDPHLDITSIDSSQLGRYDFLISSDVFEHVCAPVSRALENSYRILKSRGAMVLTVPYVAGETREHFPDLRQFTIEKDDQDFVLVGTTEDGEIRRYTDLTFHGGPGTTVECRIFGKDGLMRACTDAGFQSVRILDDSVEKFGIVWIKSDTDDARHTRGIVGLNAPPWVLVKT